MGESLERIGHAMMLAWSRIKRAQARMWGDWMIIGDGLLETRVHRHRRGATAGATGQGA